MMLKEYLVEMSEDSERTFSSFKNACKIEKFFRNIGRKISHCLNAFLKNTKELSSGFDTRIDFSKGWSGLLMSEVFTKQGLMEILEASNYYFIYQMSPFLDAI